MKPLFRRLGPLLLALALGGPSRAAAPEDRRPEALFLQYSVEDYCLDLRAALDRGESGLLAGRLDLTRLYEALRRKAPPATLQLAGVDRPEVRAALDSTIRAQFTAGFRRYGGRWSVTLFRLTGRSTAECTLTSNRYIEAGDTVYYAMTLYLRQAPGGDIRVEDVLDSSFNRLFSDTMADFVASLFPSPRQPASSATSGEEGVNVFMALVRGGSPAGVVDAYENLLSPRVRALPVFQQHVLEAAGGLPERYPAILASVMSAYPDSLPSGYRLQLRLMQGDPDALVRALDDLEAAWGYHPGLSILRLHACIRRNDRACVLETFLRAVDRDDGYSPLYWHLLRYLAREHRFDDALLAADVLGRRFHLKLDDPRMAQDPFLKDFTASPQYRNWIQKQAQSPE